MDTVTPTAGDRVRRDGRGQSVRDRMRDRAGVAEHGLVDEGKGGVMAVRPAERGRRRPRSARLLAATTLQSLLA